ncbi:hypothetical protein AV926_04715 [Myroides marinus]|uniref:Uncharacterized protein n=1 Tax=Myroides marinus TaxID=703342 RepID=A0A161UAM0_9FLAO|nr:MULTISPECIES: hypothetical protein [Myroides]KUF45154.1 hypothetical protein AS361_15125 [Myroides marinus]KZE83347.1 hypothetical protein AV926_04715 [Myroides marinus]
MNKLQLLRHSYSSRLKAYWDSLLVKRQRVLLLAVFTLYSLICLFIVKTSFAASFARKNSDNQKRQSNIRPVKYLLLRQKIESQSTFNFKNYESK